MEDEDHEDELGMLPDLCNLLTQDEAVQLLRLDQLGLRNPKETLRHLRRSGQLGYVKVAGKVLIPRNALLTYLRAQTRLPGTVT